MHISFSFSHHVVGAPPPIISPVSIEDLADAVSMPDVVRK
jgi:hypothetical protein